MKVRHFEYVKKFGLAFAVGFFLLSGGAFPQDAEADNDRTKHKFGLYGGILGDPFPTALGGNVAYNVTDFTRVTAGYGSFSVTSVSDKLTVTTIGIGAKFFLSERNLTPVVGLNYSNVTFKLTGTLGTLEVAGLSASTGVMYVNFGVDWQAGSGFNLGAGYNLSPRWSAQYGWRVIGLPYLNFGWFI